MSLLVTVAILLALILSGAFYTYYIVFYSPKSKRSSVDDPLVGEQYEAVSEDISRISHIMERYAYEAVTITSFDGCKLFGRYYHLCDGAPLEILFHGYRSCAFRDCSGGHALSRKMGFNALVVDQRAHGSSDGTTISFGIREHKDCKCWVDYANIRFGCETPIILSGLSMGAATVLMASGLDLPENVACILADSPYSAPSAIIEKVCQDMRYPVALCRPLIQLGAQLFGGFNLTSHTAKQAVKQAKVPILLIHGEDDRLVPYTMSFEIAACSSSRAVVHTFPGAGHGLSYITDPLRYEKAIYDFMMHIPALADKVSDSFRNQFLD